MKKYVRVIIRAALPSAEAAAFDAFLEEEYQRISSGAAAYTAGADSYETAYARVITEMYAMIMEE